MDNVIALHTRIFSKSSHAIERFQILHEQWSSNWKYECSETILSYQSINVSRLTSQNVQVGVVSLKECYFEEIPGWKLLYQSCFDLFWIVTKLSILLVSRTSRTVEIVQIITISIPCPWDYYFMSIATTTNRK